MSHLDIDPVEYRRESRARKLRLQRWYSTLSLEDKKRLDNFIATLSLVIADLKEERRRK